MLTFWFSIWDFTIFILGPEPYYIIHCAFVFDIVLLIIYIIQIRKGNINAINMIAATSNLIFYTFLKIALIKILGYTLSLGSTNVISTFDWNLEALYSVLKHLLFNACNVMAAGSILYLNFKHTQDSITSRWFGSDLQPQMKLTKHDVFRFVKNALLFSVFSFGWELVFYIFGDYIGFTLGLFYILKSIIDMYIRHLNMNENMSSIDKVFYILKGLFMNVKKNTPKPTEE